MHPSYQMPRHQQLSWHTMIRYECNYDDNRKGDGFLPNAGTVVSFGLRFEIFNDFLFEISLKNLQIFSLRDKEAVAYNTYLR
jgi:hypothetical protein